MSPAELRYVALADEHVDPLVAMWRASFERAVGIVDPNPLEPQKRYLLDVVVPANEIRVAMMGDTVVGFAATSPELLALLYIHPDHQGRGIGSDLLRWAKDRSSGRLRLFTFEVNEGAQRFYESRGFKVVGRGFEETWKLADIEYEWTRA